MNQQLQIQRCRIFTSSTAAPTQPVSGVGGSDPHITLSPQPPCGNGAKTNGFLFFIEGVAETYSVTIWKRDPTSMIWAKLLVIPDPSDPTALLDSLVWFTVCDVLPTELYFQTDDGDGTAGVIHLEEKGP